MTSTDKSTKTERDSTNNNDNDEDERTIFVGNLAEKVTDELLYELFLQGGPVEEISIPKDRETSKQKSYGFVRYKHAVSVSYACDIFKGTRLFGRELNIKSRNKDANNKGNQQQQQPRGLSALVHGFHANQNMMPPNMVPKLGLPQQHNQQNPMSMIDPIFLQSLGNANPYAGGDIKFGEYNNAGSDQGRNSYKDRHSRRNRNDDRRHHDDRGRQDRGGDRRTDKWKNNRR